MPIDAPQGVDTPLPPPPPISWDGLGNLIPVNAPLVFSEGTNEGKEDESGKSSTGRQTHCEDSINDGVKEDIEEKVAEDIPATWHDVVLSIAAEMMHNVREKVRVELGYSTSAVSQVLLCS